MPLIAGIPLTIAILAATSYLAGFVSWNPYYVVVGATAVWAALDSRKLGVANYPSALALPPIGIVVALALLWPVTFPWYLSLRHKIRRGEIQPGERPSGRGCLITFAVLAGLAAVAFFFMMRNPTVRALEPVLRVLLDERLSGRVNVGGGDLVLSVTNPPVAPDSTDAWARRIAGRALAAYPMRDSIRNVIVAVVKVEQRGAVTYTSPAVTYSFPAAQLLRTSSAGVTPTPSRDCGPGIGSLDGDHVGLLRLGMSADSAKALCNIVSDTIRMSEGTPERVMEAEVADGTIDIEVVDDRIWRMNVFSPRFRTRDSLGVGTPVTALMSPDITGGHGEGRVFLQRPDRCGLSWEIGAYSDLRPGFTRAELAKIAPTKSVGSVLVLGCKRASAR